MSKGIYWGHNETDDTGLKAENRQDGLLHAVLTADGMTLGKAPAAAEGKPAPGSDFGIALGCGAEQALNQLRTLSIDRISNVKGDKHQGLGLGTLILLLPDLAWDCFATPLGNKHYGREALVLNVVARIIVLACPADTGLSKAEHSRVLGRDGAKGGVHEKVQVIDITALLDMPSQALQSALRSCEVIGLMARLAKGMSVAAAIGGGPAKIMTPPEKDKTS